MNPNSFNQFLYLRAIQGYSGANAIDPELQDNVLVQEGFTEYIYRVGNASELYSVIRNGLIPGETRLKRGRHAVLFTTVNPMEDENGLGGDSMPLDEAEDRSIPELGNAFKNTVLWCNLKLAQESALQFYQTRSHAIVLYNTLPAVLH